MTAIEYQNFVTKWTELEGGNIMLFGRSGTNHRDFQL